LFFVVIVSYVLKQIILRDKNNSPVSVSVLTWIWLWMLAFQEEEEYKKKEDRYLQDGHYIHIFFWGYPGACFS